MTSERLKKTMVAVQLAVSDVLTSGTGDVEELALSYGKLLAVTREEVRELLDAPLRQVLENAR